MLDVKRMKEVTTLHDLGHTMQCCKAVEVDIEDIQFLTDGSDILEDALDEALQELRTRQQDSVYIVIKITRENN